MDNAATTGVPTGDATAATLNAPDLAAIEGLRRLHAERTAAKANAVTTSVTTAEVAEDVTLDGAACPIPSFMRGAGSCPVMGGPAEPIERSRADLFVRRLLRISDTPKDRTDASTYRSFRRSMTISAIRCTLTYVIFPIVLPGISFLHGAGPYVGILIGSIALVCDTFTIRRFFAVDHKYRWWFSTIAFGIMCLLVVLLVEDIGHVVGHLLR